MPGWEAVTWQLPAPVSSRVLPLTVQAPAAAKPTARPDVAVAARATEESSRSTSGSAAKSIDWPAFATVNVWTPWLGANSAVPEYLATTEWLPAPSATPEMDAPPAETAALPSDGADAPTPSKNSTVPEPTGVPSTPTVALRVRVSPNVAGWGDARTSVLVWGSSLPPPSTSTATEALDAAGKVHQESAALFQYRTRTTEISVVSVNGAVVPSMTGITMLPFLGTLANSTGSVTISVAPTASRNCALPSLKSAKAPLVSPDTVTEKLAALPCSTESSAVMATSMS